MKEQTRRLLWFADRSRRASRLLLVAVLGGVVLLGWLV